MSIFEQATRKKIRFDYKGQCSVEDLWDLGFEDLNTIYKNLYAQQEHHSNTLMRNDDSDPILELKIEIVKHIYFTKEKEVKAHENQIARAAKKQRILELIAKKQDESLQEKSIDELAAMVDSL